VDVVPALTPSGEVSRHLKESLDPDVVSFSPAFRPALKAATGASWLSGPGIKAQVASLARQFMLGEIVQ
jgi:hypothetical protein